MVASPHFFQTSNELNLPSVVWGERTSTHTHLHFVDSLFTQNSRINLCVATNVIWNSEKKKISRKSTATAMAATQIARKTRRRTMSRSQTAKSIYSRCSNQCVDLAVSLRHHHHHQHRPSSSMVTAAVVVVVVINITRVCRVASVRFACTFVRSSSCPCSWWSTLFIVDVMHICVRVLSKRWRGRKTPHSHTIWTHSMFIAFAAYNRHITFHIFLFCVLFVTRITQSLVFGSSLGPACAVCRGGFARNFNR